MHVFYEKFEIFLHNIRQMFRVCETRIVIEFKIICVLQYWYYFDLNKNIISSYNKNDYCQFYFIEKKQTINIVRLLNEIIENIENILKIKSIVDCCYNIFEKFAYFEIFHTIEQLRIEKTYIMHVSNIIE